MKPHALFSVAALLLLLVPELQAQAPKSFEFRDVYGRRGRVFAPRMGRSARWTGDGNQLSLAGKVIDPKTMEPTEEKEAPAAKRAPSVVPAFAAAIEKVTGKKISRRLLSPSRARSTLPRANEKQTGVKSTTDGKTAAAVVEGTLWAWNDGQDARRIGQGLEGVRHFEIADNGEAVSFIKDNNLHIVRLSDGESLPLSTDGSENLFYGELDWVYQEEVWGRFQFKGAWWSPTGAHIAFLRIDEEGVNTFTVVDHIPFDLELEHLKYPKAGSTNPRATLHIGDAKTGKVTAVDLSSYKAEDEILIVRVGWTPEGDNALFMVQNREQTWLDLNFVDPKTGKSRTLIHEESTSGWVDIPTMPRFLKNGDFVWESERTGYNHFYRYNRLGKLVATMTSGEWEARNIVRLDEEAGHITFMATKDGAIGLNAYRANLDGTGFTRLTQGRGSHRVRLSADGNYLLDTVSSLELPREQRLVRCADGKVLKVIAKAKRPAACEEYGYVTPELVSIPCSDGYKLDGTIIRPRDLKSGEKYPIWIETYSGPDSPSVRDTWATNPWHQFLAQQGYGVFQVNVRSASGRGQKHVETCYKQFGVQETKDFDDAIDWLCQMPWVDASRIGMTGWSYGGYMTAYAMTHSKKYKLGIAGAGVHDWRDYDTIYTERYMAKPQNNKEGYENSSVMPAAGNLHGHLLIIHGTMDDNVHLQNTIQLVYALQKANKQFDLMLYPKSRHGVRGPQFMHHRTLVWNTIQEHL